MISALRPTKKQYHSAWSIALLMLMRLDRNDVLGLSSSPASAYSYRPTCTSSSRSSPTSSSSNSVENADRRNMRFCVDTGNVGNGIIYRRNSKRGARHRMMAQDASQDSVDTYSIVADKTDDIGHNGVVQLSGSSNTVGHDMQVATSFEAVVNARFACTRFHRHQEANSEYPHDVEGSDKNDAIATSTTTIKTAPMASISDPASVRTANQCLALSTRAPTGFNVQPYRIVLVHSKSDKENMAQYCLGRNADRVRDSDCTAVFLADGECGRDWTPRHVDFLMKNMDDSTAANNAAAGAAPSRTRRALSTRALLKLRVLILLFSSGYPLPRFISVPLSFCVRLGVSVLACFARWMHSMKVKVQLLPTLSSAETWSQKNTVLVAMTYMLACTSRGLATCPMEGFDAHGIKRALGIPTGRYSIPLIVSAGTPYRRKNTDGDEDETDDAGLSHGGRDMSPRYPLGEVVYGNSFGTPFHSNYTLVTE